MKALLLILLLGITETSMARPLPSSWIGAIVQADSLANKQQLKELQLLIIDEIHSGRSNEDSLAIINTKLKEMNLPEMQINPEIILVYGHGILGSVEGAAIRDTFHVYCLPCETGWNLYEFGIRPSQKDSADVEKH